MSCNKNCNCGHSTCKREKGYSKRRVNTVLKQMRGELLKIDDKGDILGMSHMVSAVPCKNAAYRAFVRGFFDKNCRYICGKAARIVRVTEKYAEQNPAIAGDLRRYAAEGMFGIYRVFCELNVAGFKHFSGIDNSYKYMERLAAGAGRIFETGIPCGFGVAESLGHLDFADTRFVCNKESGLSAMFVEKEGFSERVEIQNHEESFDYEKAAMMLLLKATYGGNGTAVNIIKFVADELRHADDSRLAAKQAKEARKAEKAKKQLEAEQASATEEAQKQSEVEQDKTEEVQAVENPEDEFSGNDSAETSSEVQSKFDKEHAPAHETVFYQ